MSNDVDGAKGDSTYQERFAALVDFLDPRTLLVSDEDVRICAVLVKTHDPKLDSNDPRAQDFENHEWNKKVVQSALNANGDIIPRPFRMSSFLLVNVPLIVGMLSAQSTAATVFWQTINQSYNSVNIYYNSGGAGEVQVEELAKNYCIAVGTALTLSLGIRRLGSKGKVKEILDRVPFVVPFAAVAGAGGANVYVTRRGDIEKGIPVCNESGSECYGLSKEAGKQAVFKTILTRSVVLNIPVLILPSLLLKALPAPASAKGKLAMEVVVITMCLAGALPATLALYPPKLKLGTSELEPEFQSLVDKQGKPVQFVYANKGM